MQVDQNLYIIKRNNKIKCDISILNGKQDYINPEEILEWKNLVCKGLEVYNFEGNHFFINNNIKNITSIINVRLVSENTMKEVNVVKGKAMSYYNITHS